MCREYNTDAGVCYAVAFTVGFAAGVRTGGEYKIGRFRPFQKDLKHLTLSMILPHPRHLPYCWNNVCNIQTVFTPFSDFNDKEMKFENIIARVNHAVQTKAADVVVLSTPAPVPTLKVALLLGLAACVPAVARLSKQQMSKVPMFYRFAWVAAFAINLITVLIPGRLDDEKRVASEGDGTAPWESLFEPSGWAFAIWGIIYGAELLSAAYVGAVGEPVTELSKIVPYFLAGNLFQSLWCVSFRSQYKRVLWLPLLMLVGGGVSFGLGHFELTTALNYLTSTFNADTRNMLYLLRFPFALHTAWLACAALLNFNALLAVNQFSRSVQVAAAFFSAYGGAALGAALTLRTGDPMLALTVAWALSALSDRTHQRAVTFAAGKSLDGKGSRPGSTEQALATTEKILSNVLIALGLATVAPNPIFVGMF